MTTTVAYGDTRLPVQYWTRVKRQRNGCWHWIGPIDANGYGLTHTTTGSTTTAHRRLYNALVEELVARGEPGHLQVDHECHNRSKSCKGGSTCRHRRCVNPAHLAAKLPKDNSGASPHTTASINRAKTHCPEGHELAGDNLRVRDGKRYCYACHLANGNEARRQRRETERGEGWERRYWQLEKTHCPHGHPYEGDNLYVTPDGARQCRICREARTSAYAEKRIKGTVPRGWRDEWTHCPKGHPLSGENLYVAPKSGKRACKTCRRESSRLSNARRKG